MKYNYNKAPKPKEYENQLGLNDAASAFKVLAKDIPCQNACPAKTNVPEYIELISKNRYDDAYKINQEDNVFPGVLGRVCVRPCEDACRHNWTDIQGPVSICHLKRSSSDIGTVKAEPLDAWFDESGKRVAVIGGGPAGLAAARDLKRYGHDVTIYEKEKQLGGMLVDGIPNFRLPRDVVEKEIALVSDSGINVKTGKALSGADIKSLIEEYDAVLIAAGTTQARELQLENAQPEHLISGLSFMKDYNNGVVQELKGDVVIIGGGFTAVDCSRSCARAAKRLLGENGNVTIAYRRTEHDMAAEYEELEEIRLENIKIRTLASPVGIETNEGKVTGVRFIRNKISEYSKNDKAAIEEIPGSEFVIPAEHVIVAIGQTQDFSLLPEGVELERHFRTSNRKLFAAGDYFNGSVSVIQSVADGKNAASVIDEYLQGELRIKKHVYLEMAHPEGETGRVRDHDLQYKAPMPITGLLNRTVTPDGEVEEGFDNELAQMHSSRCYYCHYKFEIDNDKCIHCNWCIEVTPRDCIQKVSSLIRDDDGAVVDYVKTDINAEASYIFIDSTNCIRCGKCFRVCPTKAISMKKATLTACSSHGSGEKKEWIPITNNIKPAGPPKPLWNDEPL